MSRLRMEVLVERAISKEASRRGRAGAAARNRNLTPERRSELARAAARKRWEAKRLPLETSEADIRRFVEETKP